MLLVGIICLASYTKEGGEYLVGSGEGSCYQLVMNWEALPGFPEKRTLGT